MSEDTFKKANKDFWNERVSIHKASEFYGLDKLRRGINMLNQLEISELGDIRGKKVLHLQCHFGMDTLSLEMLGADVTGVDFSEEGILEACRLRDELRMKSRFIHSDVFELREILNEEFDIVFTSYGVLTWLHDISEWGRIASHYLVKGGYLYVAEIHPAAMMFDNLEKGEGLSLRYPYFKQAVPLKFEDEGTYAVKDAKTSNNTTYEWTHSLSDILMSVIDAGLNIRFFHEHQFTVWEHFPGMTKGSDGYYRFDHNIPLLFSLKATKD